MSLASRPVKHDIVFTPSYIISIIISFQIKKGGGCKDLKILAKMKFHRRCGWQAQSKEIKANGGNMGNVFSLNINFN